MNLDEPGALASSLAGDHEMRFRKSANLGRRPASEDLVPLRARNASATDGTATAAGGAVGESNTAAAGDREVPRLPTPPPAAPQAMPSETLPKPPPTTAADDLEGGSTARPTVAAAAGAGVAVVDPTPTPTPASTPVPTDKPVAAGGDGTGGVVHEPPAHEAPKWHCVVCKRPNEASTAKCRICRTARKS